MQRPAEAGWSQGEPGERDSQPGVGAGSSAYFTPHPHPRPVLRCLDALWSVRGPLTPFSCVWPCSGGWGCSQPFTAQEAHPGEDRACGNLALSTSSLRGRGPLSEVESWLAVWDEGGPCSQESPDGPPVPTQRPGSWEGSSSLPPSLPVWVFQGWAGSTKHGGGAGQQAATGIQVQSTIPGPSGKPNSGLRGAVCPSGSGLGHTRAFHRSPITPPRRHETFNLLPLPPAAASLRGALV